MSTATVAATSTAAATAAADSESDSECEHCEGVVPPAGPSTTLPNSSSGAWLRYVPCACCDTMAGGHGASSIVIRDDCNFTVLLFTPVSKIVWLCAPPIRALNPGLTHVVCTVDLLTHIPGFTAACQMHAGLCRRVFKLRHPFTFAVSVRALRAVPPPCPPPPGPVLLLQPIVRVWALVVPQVQVQRVLCGVRAFAPD